MSMAAQVQKVTDDMREGMRLLLNAHSAVFYRNSKPSSDKGGQS